MAIFKGAGVALVTPFHEDESVNYEALEELVEMQMPSSCVVRQANRPL